MSWRRADPTWRGEPSGLAVVLLHDWASDGERDWAATGVVDRLTEAGHPVFVADLPGHASSADVGVPAGREPAAWTAEAVEADLDRLRPGGILAVGFAAGALVAAHLAARGRCDVAALCLVGCDDAAGHPRAAEIAAALRDPGARVWSGDATEALAAARSDARHDRAVLADWIERAAWPAAPRLGALRTPTVLAVGGDDPRRQRLPRLAGLFHDPHVVTTPGDHRGILSSPVLTGALIDVAARLET